MKKSFILLAFLSFSMRGWCQNVGIGTNAPVASAQLDVSSTTKGFLPPRMTAAQRAAIASPAEGLLVFQTDGTKGYYYFINGGWTALQKSEGKVYPSVTICSQKWMDKNLDVTTYRNGDTIPYVTDPAAWAALTTGAWCYYNNDPSTDAIYGKLYNWYAVADARGLAPAGWHVSTDAEWTTLVTCLGGTSVAGGKLKVSGTRIWAAPNDADNSSGWAGLPGGNRADQGFFIDDLVSGLWWSATSTNTTTAWYRYLLYSNTSAGRDFSLKSYGFSVRCVKD
ncbi:MAG: fibrobacter succinogenes major paralogous domain-containing protein [Ferruginibacter sp.]